MDYFYVTNSVRFFFNRLFNHGLDGRALGSAKICAVGPRTADSIKSLGLFPDLIPNSYKAEGVVESFNQFNVAGSNILFPRADLARDIIPASLTEMGATVHAPVTYRNVFPDRLCPETIFELEKRKVDCITFTSSSTVNNFSRMLGPELLPIMLQGVTVASIGPVTSQTCRDNGLRVDIEPDEFTIRALTDSIINHLSNYRR